MDKIKINQMVRVKSDLKPWIIGEIHAYAGKVGRVVVLSQSGSHCRIKFEGKTPQVGDIIDDANRHEYLPTYLTLSSSMVEEIKE